jgi:hypothetical protein
VFSSVSTKFHIISCSINSAEGEVSFKNVKKRGGRLINENRKRKWRMEGSRGAKNGKYTEKRTEKRKNRKNKLLLLLLLFIYLFHCKWFLVRWHW